MWPDADEPGAKAMLQIAYRIAPGTHEIKILDPIKKPHAKEDGWDAADAVAAGWSQADVITWAKERLSILSTKGSSVPEPIGIPMTPKYIPPESKPYVAQVEDVTDQIEVTTSLSAKWLNTGLATSSKGIPIYNEENVLRIFERDEFFKEFVWYDTFHKKYFTRWSDFSLNGHVRPWQHEVDFIRLTTYLQRKWGLSKISLSQVKSSVIQYAHKHPKNEPLDWIKTLKWDGIARIDCCLADAFGANPTKYVSQVSKNFFISLAARIADPGCKHDNMVVLEGKQETFKSSSLNILGGPWYASIRHQVGTPNFFNAIQGKWLLEIAEFDSFRDAQLSAIKDFLSTPVDRFRLPYSVTTEDFPRVSIFVGTTNEKLYLLDTTGNRRIHPIATHSINLKFLKDSREQLFAEAYAKYISGTPWHVMDKKLQSEEAEKRRQPDPWEEIIGEFIRLKGEWGVLSSEIFGAEALNIPKERQDMKMLKRVGKIMHFLGWETKNTRGEDFVQRKIWMPIEEDPPEVIPPEVSVSVTNPPPSDPTPAI